MSKLKYFQQDNQSKNPRTFFVPYFLLAINPTSSIRDIPLAISNGLPAAEFILRDRNATVLPCRFHLYSCASMNTINLLVHQCLIKKHPDIIHRHEQFDGSNPFEPIMLEGALNVESEK